MNVSPSFAQTAIVLVRGACTPPRTRRLYRPAGHSSSFTTLFSVWARGACTPSCRCRLYRPRGAPCQPLSKCLGPIPPFASVVWTDLAGCSFQFSTCSCVSAWGWYPLPRSTTVPTRGVLIQVHNVLLLAREGPVPPPAGAVCTDPAGRPASRCLSAWGLYPLSRVSSGPTSWGARFSLASAVT